MNSPSLPAIRWQRQSQVEHHAAHSLLISLMRGLAALEVAAAHLRAESFPGLRELADPPLAYQLLAFLTAFSHQAVVVFFLISGWLVGGSLLNKIGQPGALAGYAIDRATRLWTVLLPALCLILAIGAWTGAVSPAHADFSTDNEYSAASFVGNLVGLQTILVEPFGSNFPLWSLANETWYYVQFPLLLLVFMGKSRLRQLGAATALVLLSAALPGAMTLYFSLWLLGALFSRVRIDCTPATSLVLLVITAGTAIFVRMTSSIDDLVPAYFLKHLVYSLPLVAFLASMQRPLDMASPWIRGLGRVAHVLSEFSFTLYVIHIPLIRLMRHVGMQVFGRDRLSPHAPLDYAIYFGMLLAVVAAAWLSYLLFESHTFRVRRFIKAQLQPQRRRAPITPASAK